MNKEICELKLKIQNLFANENTGHDISHLERVLDNALLIQKEEGGDLYTITISALVHDIHRLMANEKKQYVTPKESLNLVKSILIDCGVKRNKIPGILDVVLHHEIKSNKNVSLETLIIQDADALDAIGDIGINRTLKYCKANNIPIISQIPLDSPDYIPDINPISACHYIYRTMIPNANNFYTATAKKLAADKIIVLENFINKNIKNI